MQPPFVILTGASGVGKTSIAAAIGRLDPAIAVFQGDSMAAPPQEILESYGPAAGPGGASQRAFALYWIGRIVGDLPARPVLLEMQCRIAFLEEALLRHGVGWARVVLVECSDEVRDARLIQDRGQAKLANKDMANWSRFLHQEAVEAGFEILDTGKVLLEEAVGRVYSYLR